MCSLLLYLWNVEESMRCLKSLSLCSMFVYQTLLSYCFAWCFDVFHPNTGIVNWVQFFYEASEINSGVTIIVNRQFLSVILKFCIDNNYIHIVLSSFLWTEPNNTLFFSSLRFRIICSSTWSLRRLTSIWFALFRITGIGWFEGAKLSFPQRKYDEYTTFCWLLFQYPLHDLQWHRHNHQYRLQNHLRNPYRA